ncbi:hypothetical protein JTE90_019318, partial [Oedothorax gibbosus]
MLSSLDQNYVVKFESSYDGTIESSDYELVRTDLAEVVTHPSAEADYSTEFFPSH